MRFSGLFSIICLISLSPSVQDGFVLAYKRIFFTVYKSYRDNNQGAAAASVVPNESQVCVCLKIHRNRNETICVQN